MSEITSEKFLELLEHYGFVERIKELADLYYFDGKHKKNRKTCTYRAVLQVLDELELLDCDYYSVIESLKRNQKSKKSIH